VLAVPRSGQHAAGPSRCAKFSWSGTTCRSIGRSEMLLYMAARAQLTEEVLRPALDEGKIVVTDRYLLANVVYQGYGGGLDVRPCGP